MTAARKSIPLLIVLALLGGAVRGAADDLQTGVGGRVLGESSPLSSAGVYAYQLADLSFRKVLTDAKGNFHFEALPAGLYKVIAHKPGFVPVVVLLTRTAAQNYQFLELQLAPQPRGAGKDGDDFWSVRSRIPGDVLRDIDNGEAAERLTLALSPSETRSSLDLSQFDITTEMQAMTGVDQIAGEGMMSGGGLGFEGNFGQVQVGLRGSFWQLDSAGSLQPGGNPAIGQASSVTLDLAAGPASRINITSFNNRLMSRDDRSPVDFEHYQVNWSQGVGENGRSDFAAQYTEENHYHRQGLIDPLEIPEASRTWRIEGAYTMALGERNTLQAGLRYRESQLGMSASTLLADEPEADIDLFGRGGLRVRPAVLLEYGLYSTLSDGSLSLMPQGGLVLQLNPNWQLTTSGRKRVYEDVLQNPIFLPTLFSEGDLCEQGSEACYQVSVQRKEEESDNAFALTATHRKVGETLRLYFSNELFDRLESLYLVRGDELPEMNLKLTRKITPQVLATLQSSMAVGGGGIFQAANLQPYENRVRYMVTSLDTQFLSSSTGVFIAFHHISQELQPVGAQGRSAPQVELDRLRLMLSQDLNFMLDLAADWAVQLNMEVSRGPVRSDNSRDNDLRRRLMGGIAVKF
ncbi:MAG TPA: carboxypeptidase-like regulatory domain-containing protein [Thermoanaerobaculia bacterium]